MSYPVHTKRHLLCRKIRMGVNYPNYPLKNPRNLNADFARGGGRMVCCNPRISGPLSPCESPPFFCQRNLSIFTVGTFSSYVRLLGGLSGSLIYNDWHHQLRVVFSCPFNVGYKASSQVSYGQECACIKPAHTSRHSQEDKIQVSAGNTLVSIHQSMYGLICGLP